MKYNHKRYLVFCLGLLCLNVHAQDKIYYKKKKTDDWKVTEITAGYIKGAALSDPQSTHSTTHSNVLFVFNNLGNFLVIPGLYDNSIKSEVYVKNFFQQADPDFGKMDKIITVKNNIITGAFQSEKENGIDYMTGNKILSIPKKEVAVIIFRDGKHKLFATADKAFKALKSIQDSYYELAFSTKKKEGLAVNSDTQAIAAGSPPVEIRKDTVFTPIANQSSVTAKDSSLSKSTAKPSSAGSMDISIPQTTTNTDYSGSKTAASSASKQNTGSKSEARLDSAAITGLQKKALVNIKELEGYIRIISDKDTDPDQVTRTIDQALSLFINEDATVEVSSINRSDVQQYKVGVYLKRLGLLKYDKVVIEWYDVQYTSRLRKGADGNYYGFIEFEQRFTGISGDRKAYEDITRKTVEIVLKTYEKRRGGETSLEWDVFLGNIGIAVTKPS